MRLVGRSVLVTGATGGIGAAIVHELAARGCAVMATGRREGNPERLSASSVRRRAVSPLT
jgi:NAD(P)-dependent dehydrogenase (short-subunit alcohol dehydrogenase family)